MMGGFEIAAILPLLKTPKNGCSTEELDFVDKKDKASRRS